MTPERLERMAKEVQAYYAERLRERETRAVVARVSFRNSPRGFEKRLLAGTSRVVSDVPTSETIGEEMVEFLYDFTKNAKKELLIENAYIIPGDRAIANLRDLHAAGVNTKVLTNSLATHDVPAVNSHYKKWRKPIIKVGVAVGLVDGDELRWTDDHQTLSRQPPPETHGSA